VLCQHGPTEWVNLDLPLDFKAGPLKPKVKSADAGE
jgi:hypothetical protein